MDKKIIKDFEFLKKEKKILAVLLFGSYPKNSFHEKSDKDICIVAPKMKPKEVLWNVFRRINVEEKKYDVHVFEELPLYIQMDIIEHNKPIIVRDKFELSEYFYIYRKKWRDQKHRNTMSKQKLLEIASV